MKFRKFDTEFEIDEDPMQDKENQIYRQLEEYFSGDEDTFDLSISFPDSFTREVMCETSKTPCSET